MLQCCWSPYAVRLTRRGPSPSRPRPWAHLESAVESVRRYRDAVGSSVDLCIEIHRQLTAAQAIAPGRELEQFRPMFYEDPVLPDNFDEMALVAEKVAIPIATVERLQTVHEFEMLLRRGAVQYVRPDVCLCGGITGARKVAAVAEANHVGVVTHNPLSLVSTVACLHLAAAIPNFAIQEYPLGEDETPKKRDRLACAQTGGRLPARPKHTCAWNSPHPRAQRKSTPSGSESLSCGSMPTAPC